MHSTTICGSSLHVRIHLKAKNFWAKREREKQKIRANKNRKEKTTKNRQKEKKKETRNLQRIIMMNVVRPQNWSAKSQCACICVRVCAWGCVACLHYFYAMHGPRRVLTSFSYLNCPHIMPGQTNPTRLQLPRSHHPQLSPIQLNSTLNKTQVESRFPCLVPRVSSLGSAFIIILGNGLRLAQAAKTWKLCHKFTTHPKKQQAEFALYFVRVLGELIPCNRALVYGKLIANVVNALASFVHSQMIWRTVSMFKVSRYLVWFWKYIS